jgi:hypothetical protein
VITPRGVDAEVYSKVVMVSGIDGAKNYLKRHPDIRAIIFYRQADGNVASVRLNF